MKRIHFLLLFLFVMSIRLAQSAETPALIERPASGNGSTEVSVGIWIVDISNIDSAQQSFTAEIALVLRWKDPRLAHTGSGVVRYPLEQVWHPRVGIANETASVTRKFPEWVEVEPNVMRARSRNDCGCNHSRSTARHFTSKSSLSAICLTKSDSCRMRIGCVTA